MENKRKPLADHKRVGKKFIPPLKQLNSFQEIRYDRDILPEIIWMGLINDMYGYREGVQLVTRFCKLVDAICGRQRIGNIAFVGDYTEVSAESTDQILEALKRDGLLTQLRSALAPLVVLYRGFPLSFIGVDTSNRSRSDLIRTIRGCVDTHLDRYKTPGLAIQANVLYVAGLTQRVLYGESMEVPDLNSLVEDPESDAANRAAASVCTGVLTMFATSEGLRVSEWARSFWNQNLRIDACDFA